MAKFRNAQSYYGNTAEARKRQRANLIPGNSWQKRKTQEFRVDCFWEYGNFKDKRFIYEGYVDNKSLEEYQAMTENELKSEKYLDSWWENELNLEDKKHIYWSMMDPFTPEERSPILEHIQKCLKKKLAILGKG